MTRSDVGAAGERFAAGALQKGRIRRRRLQLRLPLREIDIICENAEYIVFAEVKARDLSSAYLPREAVTPQKQRRIIRSAEHYLMQNPSQKQPRFDVVELTLHGGRVADWTILDNAFGAW